jgi:hypothetical protein
MKYHYSDAAEGRCLKRAAVRRNRLDTFPQMGMRPLWEVTS